MHSLEINKTTSANEEKIESQTNTKNRNEIVIRVENLVSLMFYDRYYITYRILSNKTITIIINYAQISWELMSLKDPDAAVQTETERVYDTYGGNENINIKQTAKMAQFAKSKNNLQSVSSKTSESDNTKKIVAAEQISGEKNIF